ncbi:hypothetical protein D9V29_01745 [Mycetocola manganoxydans]|uniref:Polysaccharide biosynthesis protein n=1 Tax=Mycetocola manganoxydans TaxID=699879 RepID=A0A3L7A0F3_9MICO|nr:hypothetical protein [Mycetocola manganoxydans]RLP73435.1 hypothetical protein D9V29_01745 [Mycetocola manganoxydans]GHD41724.1 hypothetical protein GCM10008097_06810 [Mycetocola manganoxydans]
MSESKIAARHAIYNALSTVAIQGIAIVTLSPADYGQFSLFYLVFALASSVIYSVVSEAWARNSRLGRPLAPWRRYCTSLTLVALLTLPVSAAFFVFGIPILLTAAFAGSVAISSFRVGARYYSSANARHRFVGGGDLAGAIAMILGFALFQAFLPALDSVALAWLVSSFCAVLLGERPRFEWSFGLRKWVSAHRASIRSLLADSVMLDAGSIGVPLLLAPLLGVANFGVYRSISSAALPVRLALNPLRPLLARMPLEFFAAARIFWAVLTGAIALGLATYLGLWLITAQGWFSTSVLSDLAAYALPTSIFVGTNLIGMFYYLVSRTHLPGRRLLQYRATQLLGAIVLPIAGYLVGGLTGAIWGFTLISVLLGSVIVSFVMKESHSSA